MRPLAWALTRRTLPSTAYDLLLDSRPTEELIIKTNIKHLDMIPANINLVEAELQLVERTDRETVLRDRLASVRDYYDYIIIDCPPSLGLLT